ncbi:MAG: hypothetical protein Kow00108_00470 [Calditrichia bacterium]
MVKYLTYALIILFIFPQLLLGKNIYVSLNGSDQAAGTIDAPLRTMNVALNLAEPGDSISILGNNFEPFIITSGGLEGNPVVISSYNDSIRIEGSVNYQGRNSTLHITAGYISLIGLHIYATSDRGIRISSGISEQYLYEIKLINCKVFNAGLVGVTASYVDSFVVDNCEVAYTANSHGLYISNSSDRCIVKKSYFHHNGKAGLQVNADMEMPGDHISSDILIENNIFIANCQASYSAGLNLASVRNSIIRNNFFFDNRTQGMALWDDGYSSWGDPNNFTYGCKNNIIVNNTIINPEGSSHCLSFRNGSTDNKVFNNIFIHLGNRDGIAIDPESNSNFISDYNIITYIEDPSENLINLEQWQSLYQQDLNSQSGNVQNVLENSNDYILNQNSIAIDAANGNYLPPLDIDGKPRIDIPEIPNKGTGPIPFGDIGCSEFGESLVPIVPPDGIKLKK